MMAAKLFCIESTCEAATRLRGMPGVRADGLRHKMMKNQMILWFSVVLVLASAGTGKAQQAASDGAAAQSAKGQMKAVVLAVTVRDKKGQVVPNVKAADLTLEVDGSVQAITSLSREATLPLRLGVVVDTGRSQEAALPGERTASGKFMDQMLMQPGDKAFLLHFDRDVELLQDFTGSKDKLHRELDALATGAGPQAGVAGVSAPDGDAKDGSRRSGSGEAKRGGGGTALYDALYLASTELMQPQAGRKALVVLTDGSDRGSRKSMNDAVDAAERAGVSVYAVYFKGVQERGEFDHGSVGMDRGGYPGGGYPGGGYPGGYPDERRRPTETGASRQDGKKTLEKIALRTGGRIFEVKKKDGFDEVYGQIAEELRGQYLLTYTPEKPKARDDGDGFHKIVLKAKDDQVVVTTREGYYSTE